MRIDIKGYAKEPNTREERTVKLRNRYKELYRISKEKGQEVNAKPYSYPQFQTIFYSKTKVANPSNKISNYVTLELEGTYEVLGALKYDSRHDIHILVYTTCSLHDWITRSYGTDSIKIGVLYNEYGKSYYMNVKKMLRTVNFLENLSKSLDNTIDLIGTMTPSEFKKKAVLCDNYAEIPKFQWRKY